MMRHGKPICQAFYAGLGGGLIVFSIGFGTLAAYPKIREFIGDPGPLILVTAPTISAVLGCFLIALAIFKWDP